MEIIILASQIFLSLFVVWLSITLGEKLSIKYAGLVTSFPTIVALVILFIGLSQGQDQAGIAAYKISHAIVLFNIWMLYYLLLAKLKPVIAALGSILLYAVTAFLFYYLFNLVPVVPYAYIFFVLVLAAGFFVFPQSSAFKINNNEGFQSQSLLITLIKYALAPILVIGFTYLSKLVGPIWAGIFVSAPSTGLVTVFYFHYKYGNTAAVKTLESFYLFTGTFVVFGLTIYFLTPLNHFILTFIVAMITTALYAFLVNLKLIPWLRKKI